VENSIIPVQGNRFRRARFARFLKIVAGIKQERDGPIALLDVGGMRAYWESMRDLWQRYDLQITMINLDVAPENDAEFRIRPGNACAMPEYADASFDIVHSNSVIEHVGHWPQMMAMAQEVRRVGRHYYLQTPNFWFPYEPHYRTLFFQMYPESIRAAMLMRKRRGFRGPMANLDEAMRNIQDVNLLTARQMQTLFPDATLEKERVLGLAKSLIVWR
jgi:hypothetical protein